MATLGVKQLQSLAKPLDGIVGHEPLQRLHTGTARILNRFVGLRRLGGRAPVTRQLTDALPGVIAAQLLERNRDALVCPRSPRCP